MNFLANLQVLALKFFRRGRVENEMEAELRSHVEHRADDLVCTGLSRREAIRRAQLEFGGHARFKEEAYESMGGNFIETTIGDVRYGLRMLRKSPGFSVVAALTLALAIGANAVVFSVMNAVMLRPLNVPDAQSLYGIEHGTANDGSISYLNYIDLRDRNRSFDGLAAFDIDQARLYSGQNPSSAWVYGTSGNYFDVLELQPYLGRFFHESDEYGPNSAPYIVLSYAYWHTHFQDDRNVVGRAVEVNKHPFTILGVAPPGFTGRFYFSRRTFLRPL